MCPLAVKLVLVKTLPLVHKDWDPWALHRGTHIAHTQKKGVHVANTLPLVAVVMHF